MDCAVERGQPAHVITAMAHDVGADIIVMTTHGRSSIEQFFVSDVAERVIRQGPLSGAADSPYGGVAQPAHPFPSAARGSRWLVECGTVFCATRGSSRKYSRARFCCLGVPEADFEEEELGKYLETVAQALRERGLKARAIVTGSGSARTIVAVSESEDADLILLAKNGRGSSQRPSRSWQRGQPSDPNHATSCTAGGHIGRRIQSQATVSTADANALCRESLMIRRR